ncbi:MAG TPA: hypothetical protein VF881_02510 [Polyangiaceae bacterium]
MSVGCYSARPSARLRCAKGSVFVETLMEMGSRGALQVEVAEPR